MMNLPEGTHSLFDDALPARTVFDGLSEDIARRLRITAGDLQLSLAQVNMARTIESQLSQFEECSSDEVRYTQGLLEGMFLSDRRAAGIIELVKLVHGGDLPIFSTLWELRNEYPSEALKQARIYS